MKIGIEVDVDQARAGLGELQRQVPFATALALTRTAEAAKVSVQQEMASVFDRPTSFALNALRVLPATKSRLEAQVFLKDLGGRNIETATTRFAAHVFGGDRNVKKFEAMLRGKGMLLMSEDAVPGEGARLNANGNIDRAQIVEILRWFDAMGAGSYGGAKAKGVRERLAAGSRRRYPRRYFFRRERPGRGIYIETTTGFGKSIQPVLMFVRRSMYKRRLDAGGVVERTVQTQFRRWFDDAFAQAVRTSR